MLSPAPLEATAAGERQGWPGRHWRGQGRGARERWAPSTDLDGEQSQGLSLQPRDGTGAESEDLTRALEGRLLRGEVP